MALSAILARLHYAAIRARQEGFVWSAREILVRSLLWLCWFILLPLSIPLHFMGYRRLPVFTERIGHFAAELDCFLKLVKLGKIPLEGRRYFLLAPRHKVSNRCLLEYWRPHVQVVSHGVACFVLELMTRGLVLRHEVASYVLAINRAAEYFSVNAEWGDRPPLLALAPAHRAAGVRALSELGIPKGAWFVCVHAREGAYSPQDESVHDYRNVKIESLIPAMREIVRRGGYCVRMGDPSMPRLPAIDGIVDYAHSALRSPELDVILCASSRFFLGSTSGLFIVSSVFGVPSALTNMVPFASMGFCPRDLCIPKLIRSSADTRMLTSAEILSSPAANFRMSRLYRSAGLELIDCSEEEILDLAEEMLEGLEGGQNYRSEEIVRLRARFRRMLRTEHYCFGSVSNIGGRFLLRHERLFS